MELLIGWVLVALPSILIPLLAIEYPSILQLRREEMEKRLASVSEALGYYRKMFVPEVGVEAPVSGSENEHASKAVVDRIFDRVYSYKSYLLPCILSAVITTIAMVTILVKGEWELGLPDELVEKARSVDIATVTGFAGAYLWGIFDLLQRRRSIDLAPTAINSVWARFLIAPVAGYVLSIVLKDGFSAVVAFGIGAFPVKSVRDYFRSEAGRKLGVSLDLTKAEPPNLHLLQGATPEVISRLSEEGISSCQQLSLADPVELFVKTSFRWHVILDLIDQALLHTYVGDKIVGLRDICMRSSFEVSALYEMLLSSDKQEIQRAKRNLKLLAAKLGEDFDTAKYLADTLWHDDQVALIKKLWSESYSE